MRIPSIFHSRNLIGLSILGGCLALSAGCGKGQGAVASATPLTVAALAAKPHPAVDLSKPFNVMAWSNGGAQQDHLSVATQFALSAGGDWLAITPKPLDSVNWQPSFPRYNGAMSSGGNAEGGQADDSINACLKAVKESGTPVSWEMHDGRMLLYFGPDEELAHLHAHPPESVNGLFLCTHSSAGMLSLTGDFWKLRIQADPMLLQRRDNLLAVRKNVTDSDEPRGILGALAGMYRGGMGGRQPRPLQTDMLTLRLQEKTTSEQLMHRIALLLGGEARKTSGGWEIDAIKDQAVLQSEMSRLKAIVDEKSGAGIVHTTPNPITAETMVVISALPEEAQAAMENLTAFGLPAIPTLTDYLRPEKAAQAQIALRLLGALQIPEARKAVMEFGRKLQSESSLTGDSAKASPLLQAEIVKVLSRNPDKESLQWLAEATRDTRLGSDLRHSARMSLIENGAAALLAPAMEQRSASLVKFDLATYPDGSPAPSGNSSNITPVANCKAEDGSTWSVFFSGRFGDPADMWLAHGKGRTWSEFLFTGHVFPRQNMGYNPYGGMKMPGVGCMIISVKGKEVTLSPPSGQTEDAEVVKMRAQLSNGKLTAQQRANISRMIAIHQQQVWQRRANNLQQELTYDLTELRKDTDHDGLTDLVEARLGTDPHRADTDGDGIPDSRDTNPLIPAAPNPSVRQRLVQEVFSALFAGDPNPDLIIVILEKPDWQEFRGTRGPVLCMTKADFLHKANRFTACRVLQFGGTSDQKSTILNLDGPCAFNETRTRAEMHFWQWGTRSQVSQPWMIMYSLDPKTVPVDYVATFSRRGSAWKLDGMKPWRADTVDSAMGEYMKKSLENGMQ